VEPMQLWTATRSARRSLDLNAVVEASDGGACLRIACQAANGSNPQSWCWLAVSHPDRRRQMGGLYGMRTLA
jgi:hypothetical protein